MQEQQLWCIVISFAIKYRMPLLLQNVLHGAQLAAEARHTLRHTQKLFWVVLPTSAAPFSASLVLMLQCCAKTVLGLRRRQQVYRKIHGEGDNLEGRSSSPKQLLYGSKQGMLTPADSCTSTVHQAW